MTENNCEFTQEPGVGNSVNVSSEIKETSGSSEDPRIRNYNSNCINSPEELNLVENGRSESPDIVGMENEEELQSLQEHWLKLSSFFRKVYHTILDGEQPPDEYESHIEIVKELISNDPHQLFARLEMELQEFIIEVKLRQMELSNCVHTDEGPHLFIFCLIEGYSKLMFAAEILSPVLQQLEIEHLSNFKITWRSLNQHFFHKLVFTEPKIQKVLPFCISKLGKTSSELSDFNKGLIRHFLNFDDEMTRIGGKWREAESAIIKYHQENSMLDAKERMMKANWELIKTQTKAFHEELKSSGLCDNFYSENIKKAKKGLESNGPETCECCNLSISQCLSNSVPLSLESLMELRSPKSSSPPRDMSREDAEILAHLNADGKKMYSHLNKFKAQQKQQLQQQTTNGPKAQYVTSIDESTKDNFDVLLNPDQSSSKQNTQLPSPMELHKTLIRTQHQRKLMQMMQSTQPKDTSHKIQKQLQEHQLLLEHQRKMDELETHIMQQHPMHFNEGTRKKIHSSWLMQTEKFHQGPHSAEQKKSPPTSHKPIPKAALNPNPTVKCNHPKSSPPPQKPNHKCANIPNSINPSNHCPSGNQGASKPNANVTHKNSMTQTNASASANGQNRARNHPLPDVVKSASYICPKHSETNKNVPHNHGDHCHSSDNSGDEDCNSERSNSPQRHCDCCYCEVFGISSAPVSRNFQETRERLRLILTKKKAKSNITNNEKIDDQRCSTNQPAAAHPIASQGIKVKKDEATYEKKANPVPEYKGDKSIEEILDFIEGNKVRNMKRTAKKLRRKQRQEEEERRKREEEEAERRRLEEIRRKEEEEKRRLEEERRRQELKEQNRKKNKKKNGKQINQRNIQTLNNSNKKNKKKNQSQSQTADKKVAQNQRNQEQIKNMSHKQGVQLKNQSNQPQKKGKPEPIPVKQQNKQKVPEKQKNQTPVKNAPKKSPNQTKNAKEGDSDQPQMVTIKRVMQPNSNEPTVTITLRGATPKEDKVLYTLLNGQMCQIKDEKGKKQPANVKKNIKPNSASAVSNNFNGYPLPNSHSNTLPSKNMSFNKSCGIVGSGVNNITERMERLKLGSHPMPCEPGQKLISAPTVTQSELTTPTAIQINQAVNQLSSRPTFPNNFDLENIKLPPGITITKVDPATVNRKPIQMKQQTPQPQPQPQSHIRQTLMQPMAGSSNVIVVDTGEKNPAVNGMKKRRRRRKKDRGEQISNNIPSPFGVPNGLASRMGSVNPGIYGNPFMSADYRNPPQPPAAIIQMNGSMVTIRNPALHQALTGQQMEFHDGTKTKNQEMRNSNFDENVFSPAPEEIENGDIDEYERELEAFKRFCSQSVPAESKAKVNLNLEDIVLKKKGPVIGCS